MRFGRSWQYRAVHWASFAGVLFTLLGLPLTLLAFLTETRTAAAVACFSLVVPGCLYLLIATFVGVGHRWALWLGLGTSGVHGVAATYVLLVLVAELPLGVGTSIWIGTQGLAAGMVWRLFLCLWHARRDTPAAPHGFPVLPVSRLEPTPPLQPEAGGGKVHGSAGEVHSTGHSAI